MIVFVGCVGYKIVGIYKEMGLGVKLDWVECKKIMVFV